MFNVQKLEDRLNLVNLGKKIATERIREGVMRDELTRCFDSLKAYVGSDQEIAVRAVGLANQLMAAVSEASHTHFWWLLRREVRSVREQMSKLYSSRPNQDSATR